MVVQEATRSAIEETNAQFAAAAGRGDTAAMAALYTEDAVVLAPNVELMRGRQAIKALFDGLLQQMGAPQLTIRTIQLDELGDAACEVGAYTLKAQPPGGEPINDNGKTVVIWKRQGDGSWKMAVDIWNSNLPLPSA